MQPRDSRLQRLVGLGMIMISWLLTTLAVVGTYREANALNNGVARTPPSETSPCVTVHVSNISIQHSGLGGLGEVCV